MYARNHSVIEQSHISTNQYSSTRLVARYVQQGKMQGAVGANVVSWDTAFYGHIHTDAPFLGVTLGQGITNQKTAQHCVQRPSFATGLAVKGDIWRRRAPWAGWLSLRTLSRTQSLLSHETYGKIKDPTGEDNL